MGKMTVEFKYGFGDIVYLKTDLDQTPRIVLQINISPKDSVTYQLGSGDYSSWHFEIEISIKKDILVTSTN